MRDHEGAMLLYTKLAELSQQKRQLLGRDKFLLLAGMAACRAGWPEVAQRCRQLVLAHNRVHLVGRFETIADALRDAEFQLFAKRLEIFCPYEKAEYLLVQTIGEENPARPHGEQTDGQAALEILSGTHWEQGAHQ